MTGEHEGDPGRAARQAHDDPVALERWCALAAAGVLPAGLVARALRGYRLAPAAAAPDDAAETEVEAEQPFAIVLRARAIAAGAGWPDEAVHFEHFKNTQQIDTTSSFEIALARSAMTLRVPAGGRSSRCCARTA